MTSAAGDKRLLLLRHAKAEAGLGVDDHDRGLTDSGRRDAAAVGQWLAAQGIVCQLVICSTAIRTRQTWDVLAHHGAHTEFVEYRRRVYQGGPTGALEVIAEDGGDLDTILVVGHAPTMPVLASLLTDGQGSAAAHAELAAGFPTSAIAALTYSGHWADLGPGTASLESFFVGRG